MSSQLLGESAQSRASELVQQPLQNSASARSRSLRVVLFTDTLGDVNGVSRFIRTIAEQARELHTAQPAKFDLHVVTSTRFECPREYNVHNLKPIYTRPMPGYATLDVVVPHGRKIRDLAQRLNPDVVHVSTPGPVGSVGRSWALKRGLPLVGTYHTDFPAYVHHLFDDTVLTWVTTQAMRKFYKPFQSVFTRSVDYAQSLHELGVHPSNVVKLTPGIDTRTFHTGHRVAREEVWKKVKDARAASVKLLYCGRVSVEKNVPLLEKLWPKVRARVNAKGVDTQLVIIGDGPYREKMERSLSQMDVLFLGFKHGQELSRLYAGCDAFVFPSTTDTLGQVVMEAQSSGLPVVVSDQGGPGEVVDEGLTGYVLKTPPVHGAEELWVARLVELLTDHSKRAQMGELAHAKIQSMSIRDSFEHFWDVHERVHAQSQ